MMINTQAICDLFEKGILKAINKFREKPKIFFTEADLRSYLYHNQRMPAPLGEKINCLDNPLLSKMA